MSLCALREAQPPNTVWMSLYKPHFLWMKLSFHFWSPVSFLADQFPIFSIFSKDSLLHVADMAGAPCFASSLRHHPGTCEVSHGMIGILSCPMHPGNWKWMLKMMVWKCDSLQKLPFWVSMSNFQNLDFAKFWPCALTDNSWKLKRYLLSEHLYLHIFCGLSLTIFCHW